MPGVQVGAQSLGLPWQAMGQRHPGGGVPLQKEGKLILSMVFQ